MKKFEFKFSSVLEVRKRDEKESLRLLAESQKVYQNELDKKANLLSQLQTALEHREMLGVEPVSISDFYLQQNHIIGIKQHLLRADQAIVRATRGVQKALRVYLLARKESKVMETLYEQARNEHRKLVLKEEQKRLDDLMVMRSRLKEESSE